MTGRTHIVGSVAALWLVAPWFSTQTVPAAVGCLAVGALVGSLLPDMDSSQATIAHFSFRFNERWLRPFAEPSRLLTGLLGHRGALHSATAWFVTVTVTALVATLWFGASGTLFALGLAMGYASHLVLDGMTLHGIPLYWPSRKIWHALPRRYRFSTGTPGEDAVFIPLALAAVTLLLIWLRVVRLP